MKSKLEEWNGRLRVQIAEAFNAVVYPGDDNLYEGWQRDDDYEDVVRRFTSKHWRDFIPNRKPPKGSSHPLEKDMSFCSPAAWHFFLPAYLITSLMMNKAVACQLEPQENASARLRGYTAARFGRLTADQCAVTASFCAYVDTLLGENQKQTLEYAGYFEAKRHELVPALLYWNSRIIQQL